MAAETSVNVHGSLVFRSCSIDLQTPSNFERSFFRTMFCQVSTNLYSFLLASRALSFTNRSRRNCNSDSLNRGLVSARVMNAVLIFFGAEVSLVLVNPPQRHRLGKDVRAPEHVTVLRLAENPVEKVLPDPPQKVAARLVRRFLEVLKKALQQEFVVLLGPFLDRLEPQHVQVVFDRRRVAC